MRLRWPMEEPMGQQHNLIRRPDMPPEAYKDLPERSETQASSLDGRVVPHGAPVLLFWG